MKKIILALALLMVMIVPLVSAWDLTIDNYKDVSPDLKTVEIWDKGIIGEDTKIVTLELNTEHHQAVGIGYQKVAEFTIKNHYENVNDILEKIEFYNIKLGMKPISIDYDIRYEYKTEVVTRNCVVDNLTMKESCKDIISYNIEHLPYTPKTILKDEVIKLSIWTTTKQGDRVEWIPTLYGEEIEEWASWNAELNTNLFAYYKFNESVNDTFGNYNGTNGGTIDSIYGIINNSRDFDGSNDLIDLTGLMVGLNTSTEFSFSLWFNASTLTGDRTIIADTFTGVGFVNYAYRFNSATGLQASFESNNLGICDGSGGWWADVDGGTTFTANTYYHLVLVQNATGDYTYINGVNKNVQTCGAVGTYQAGDDDIVLGKRAYNGGDGADGWFDGTIDEVAFWNRSLTLTEIETLYNGGAGITYTPGNNIAITLNEPEDVANLTDINVVFNCTGSTSDGIIGNVSLIINGTYNVTNSSPANNTPVINTVPLAEGNWNWSCEICDSSDDCLNATARTLGIDTTPPVINITYPIGTINYHEDNTNLTLNYTASDTNIDSCWFEYEGVNTSLNCSLTTYPNMTITNASARTIILWANDTFGNEVSDTETWNYNIFKQNESYNATAYETDKDYMFMNISGSYSTMTARLWYNGVANTPTETTQGDSIVYGYSTGAIPLLAVENTAENRTFIWEFRTDLGNYNITHNQTVAPINLTLCNSGTAYLNVTFKNEVNGSTIPGTMINDWVFFLGNGSQSRTNYYTNSSPQLNHAMCFLPVTKTMNVTGSSTHSGTDYPARSYLYTGQYDNATDNITIYLLHADDGIYQSVIVQNAFGSPLEGVSLVVERQFSGVWTEIEYGLSGSDGAESFWLSNDYQHRITASLDGYDDELKYFTPNSENAQIITMGDVGDYDEYDYSRGVTIDITPVGTLINDTYYIFNLSLTSSYWNLTEFGFTLKNGTGTELGSNSSTEENGEQLILNLSTGGNTSIIMYYYWNANDTFVNGTRSWIVHYSPDRGVNRFLRHFGNFIDDGSGNGIFGLNPFAMGLIIFILIFGVTGFICYEFGVTSFAPVMTIIFSMVALIDAYAGLFPYPATSPLGQGLATVIIGIITLVAWIRETMR